MSILLRSLLVSTVFFLSTAQASHLGGPEDKLNVPGDFPGSFHMDLLSASAALDIDPAFGVPGAIATVDIDTAANQILFDASPFDGVGAGEGTSTLALTSLQATIGTSVIFGSLATFYIDGPGVGSLVDLAASTAGDWTLTFPLFADWNGNTFEFPDFTLSSAATYAFQDVGGPSSLSGVAMDYHTGDTFLVGQSTIASGTFEGIRLTLGIDGNDPLFVASAVPVPAALPLLLSGIVGLFSVARYRRSS